jgi:hypothetical protein
MGKMVGDNFPADFVKVDGLKATGPAKVAGGTVPQIFCCTFLSL